MSKNLDSTSYISPLNEIEYEYIPKPELKDRSFLRRVCRKQVSFFEEIEEIQVIVTCMRKHIACVRIHLVV